MRKPFWAGFESALVIEEVEVRSARGVEDAALRNDRLDEAGAPSKGSKSPTLRSQFFAGLVRGVKRIEAG